MGTARERNPEQGQKSVRAKYVHISVEEPLNSANKQKATIRHQAKTQKFHITLTRSNVSVRANTRLTD